MTIIVNYKDGTSAPLSEHMGNEVAYYADPEVGKRFIPWTSYANQEPPANYTMIDEILFADGSYYPSNDIGSYTIWDWGWWDGPSRIIGYSYKPGEEVLVETNTEEYAYIKRKTVSEIYEEFQDDAMFNRDDLIDYLKELDIIREETLLEKFEEENDIKLKDCDIELFNMITQWMENRSAD